MGKLQHPVSIKALGRIGHTAYPGMSFLQTIVSHNFWTQLTSSDRPPGIPNDVKSPYEELTLGVWRVLVMKDSFFSAFDFRWESFSMGAACFLNFLYDVYTISPRLFSLCIMGQFWSAIEGPLGLYLSNRLFFCVGTLNSPILALTGGLFRLKNGRQEALPVIVGPQSCILQ